MVGEHSADTLTFIFLGREIEKVRGSATHQELTCGLWSLEYKYKAQGHSFGTGKSFQILLCGPRLYSADPLTFTFLGREIEKVRVSAD